MTPPEPDWPELLGVVDLYRRSELDILRAAREQLLADGFAADTSPLGGLFTVGVRGVQAAARAWAVRMTRAARRAGAGLTGRATAHGAQAAAGQAGRVLTGQEAEQVATAAEAAIVRGRDDEGHLAAAVEDFLVPAHRSILRTVDDAYRATVADATARMNNGATRRDAAQHALDRLADQGITSFTDRAGRRWEAASYAEMALRTGSRRTAVDAHMQVLTDGGFDLVYVSDHRQECWICRPWEHRVLSISGADDDHPSLATATAAGLLHPNCRHVLNLYVEGATRLRDDTGDEQGEDDRAQLRYLERQLRKWKKRQAAAVDDQAAAQARVKVRDYQRRIRAHTRDTSAKRQTQREQIDRAR